MASIIYNTHWNRLCGGTIDWATPADVRAIILVATTTTPTNKQHDFAGDIDTDEASASGYAEEDVTSVAGALDDTNHRYEVTSDNWDFGTPAAGETAGHFATFEFITNRASSPLIALHEISGGQAFNGQAFVGVIGSEGFQHYRSLN